MYDVTGLNLGKLFICESSLKKVGWNITLGGVLAMIIKKMDEMTFERPFDKSKNLQGTVA